MKIKCQCGGELFEKCLCTGGWWRQIVDSDGNVVDTDLSSVRYGPEPKTVRCVECGKRVTNPTVSK